MSIRTIILAAGLAFLLTLAVVAGWRLSGETLAVVLGVVAGVAASIPTSLIVVWLAVRAVSQRPLPEPPPPPAPERAQPRRRAEPRVVVVPPPQFAQAARRRDFRYYGTEDDERD